MDESTAEMSIAAEHLPLPHRDGDLEISGFLSL
jgi:hypothetical protein